MRVARDFEVPTTISSYHTFERTIVSIWEFVSENGSRRSNRRQFLDSMYYLLGWLVGDAGKDMGSPRKMTARLRFGLSRRHPENRELGNYLMRIVGSLGIRWTRLPDTPPTERVPCGSFRWNTFYSPILGWMLTAALGLDWSGRTTRNPVKMKWVLAAPRRLRIWFLRGLADSDGSLVFGSREVSITSQPNTRFFSELLNSLGVRNFITEERNRDFGVVTFSVPDAARIQVFSPYVMTHRRRLLEKLGGAKTFPRHWPKWLELKVTSLLQTKLGVREICETILEENHTFIRTHTVRRKAEALGIEFAKKSHGRDSISGPPPLREPYQGGALVESP